MLNERLTGGTLGDRLEDNKDDWKSWIKDSKKRERELMLAKQKARELESQDQHFQEYAESTSQSVIAEKLDDLIGIRVGHDIKDIEEGNNIILTLKDRGILDEDEGKS